ncbi:hypothetical protein [Lacrimispora sp. JR3]|uniref:hypothetical protein n=1 Tax=Lacrimispora sinapis TaxID=3111456 RepID=UPI0037485CA6
MNKIQVKKTWFQTIHDQYESIRRQQRKKLFRFKIKLFLTLVLPVLIVVLGIQVARTFIQLKIRQLFTKPLPGSREKEASTSDHEEHLPK